MTWNNYQTDIGEGRQYRGHWIKPKDWAGKNKGYAKPADSKADTGPVNSNNMNKKTQWMGFGIIEFPDGSKYSGQTENGQFHGAGRMVHPNGDIYQGNWKDG